MPYAEAGNTHALQPLGVNKVDRVLITLEHMRECYAAMIDMVKLGVITMPGTVLRTA